MGAECHSTPAKTAASSDQSKRHPKFQNKLLSFKLRITLLHIFKISELIYGHVFYAYQQTIYEDIATYLYGTKLIQTRTEPLQNNEVFKECFT